MKLNDTRSGPTGCEPPPIPTDSDLYGPEQLSELVIESRKLLPGQGWAGPISDDGIRKLVKLVFFASLMPEEGRYPRYNLVCQEADGSHFLVTKIESILLSVDRIRRLAPACAQSNCALLVTERGDSFWCDGVLRLPGGAPNLQIDVLGPSHLRIHEGVLGYELQVGRIRGTSHLAGPKPIQKLLADLQDRIVREVSSQIGADAIKHDYRVKEWTSSTQILARLLRTAADAQHGGAFVFLPEADPDLEKYGLKVPYRTTKLDLGAVEVDQWVSYLQSLQQYGTQEERDHLFWRREYQFKLETCTEVVGHFSCVDGFVVLTREFKVLGFGAKIDAPVERAENSPRRYTHSECDDETFMKSIGGTRHQSVARFCQIHPDVMVFTLSQDGELKLFCSDEQNAYAYGPLDLTN